METKDIKKVTPAMRDALRSPLPKGAIKPHPTKTYLSSIKAIYVTERLNDVFGVGSWQTRVEKESVTDGGMVVVKVIFTIPEYGIYYECYGGNDNGGESSKNFDLGDAYKGAATDALTKIGSWLEIGIDVFKGLVNNTGQSNESAQTAPEKPFLNERDEDYKAAEVAIRSGQPAATVIGNLRKGYRLSKAVNEKLEAIKPVKKDKHHITTADLMEYHEIINSGGTVDPKDTKRSTSLRGIAHTVASLKSKAVDMAKVKDVYTLDAEVEAFFGKVANG